MNLIKDMNAEESKLYEWACSNDEADYLNSSWKTNDNSYYLDYEDSDYVSEYGFESIPELAEKLKEMWIDDNNMKGVDKICAVAAFKHKPRVGSSIKTCVDKTTTLDIPDFVYIF